jgi:hypothetical protein
MAWQPDSTTSGFIGPNASPTPLQDDAYDDLLHDLIAGITNIAPDLIRPRWQPEPPPRPDISVDWVAFGITEVDQDWLPSIVHVDTGEGFDAFQRFEVNTVLVTFYGPNSGRNVGLLKDGLFIDQNVAELRKNAVAIVEVGASTTAPELFNQRWQDRTDLPVHLRREIRRDYPVRNLLRAQGTITAQGPFDSTRTIEDDWDTINEE